MKFLLKITLAIACVFLFACDDTSSAFSPAEPNSVNSSSESADGSSSDSAEISSSAKESSSSNEKSSSSSEKSSSSSEKSISSSEISSSSAMSSSSSEQSSAKSSSSSIESSSSSEEPPVQKVCGDEGTEGWFKCSSKESYLNPDIQYDSIVDERDGKVYKIVQIGEQVWMAQNLDYRGDTAANPELAEYASCYMLDSNYCTVAGSLYSWWGAVDCYSGCQFKDQVVHGACPRGWHIPSKSDMQTLIYSVARVSSDSLVGQALKSTTGWSNDSNGTDLFGFSAIPTGYRGSAPRGPNYVVGGGGYVDLRSTTCFWTSQAVYSESWAYSLRLRSNENTAELVYQYWQKSYRCSVRCVKD